MPELVRSFICIDFPDEIIKEITRVQSELAKTKFQGKLTEPENLHLTLKFLGEVPKEVLEKVKSLLSSIKFQKLELKLGKVGVFSHRGNPRIVWIKLEGAPIFKLQKEIDKSLKDLFPKEERFMSHLTIARIKHAKDKRSFDLKIKSLTAKKLKFEIDSFRLVRSELKTLGPIYTTLADFKSNN